MKVTHALFGLTLLMAGTTFSSYAASHDKPVLTWNEGRILGGGDEVIRMIDKNGTVESGSADIVGRVEHNGKVYDAGGMLLGVLHPDHKVTNNEGMMLGYGDKEGNIHGYRKILGHIDSNGLLVDSQGNMLGKFPKGDTDIAALYVLGVLP